ncbi:alanine racemase [Spirochaeta cellobiosiphila]|uniref:alanine racemase n=1 Tax=Spirochaeta cellobiosiphila TaxID=504483 RepID=UPI0003F9A574|nr:alanine racemase [Spirochaeta cellobiosiphila]
MRSTYANIYMDNLRHNYNEIRKLLPRNVKTCGAVKADAYGHGQNQIAKELSKLGMDYFGVATYEEGLSLRLEGISTPILMLGYPESHNLTELVSNNIDIMLPEESMIEPIVNVSKKLNRKVNIHINIDTGMGRIGIKPEEVFSLGKKLQLFQDHIIVKGLCTHFPIADQSPSEFTDIQLKRFEASLATLKSLNINPDLIHAANSGAIIDKAHSLFNMVRPGIILYGYYPSLSQERNINFKPVMELVSSFTQIKKVEKGTTIGYGRTYIAKEDTYIGTVPVGYADGYFRSLSNKAKIYSKGKYYPIAGTICMDQFMVDLGESTNIKSGDSIILFGPSCGITAEDLAGLCGTISYEILCSISKRVPRYYI